MAVNVNYFKVAQSGQFYSSLSFLRYQNVCVGDVGTGINDEKYSSLGLIFAIWYFQLMRIERLQFVTTVSFTLTICYQFAVYVNNFFPYAPCTYFRKLNIKIVAIAAL
jgi:hypothetical protein